MLFYAGNPFTDAVGKSFAVTSGLTSVLTVATGITAAMTGKMAMLGATNATGALPSGFLGRKLYYIKYISSTTCSLHNSADDAVNGVGAVTVGTGTFVSGVSLALLS
jgi:hypothetical protein